MLSGISDKLFLEGTLCISKKNRQDGYVRFEGLDDVFIPGVRHQNRALNGDIVVVRSLENEELEKEKTLELEKKAERTKKNQERQSKVNFFKEEDDDEPGTFALIFNYKNLMILEPMELLLEY